MDAFFERISHPALSDIEIDWSGMQVEDVFPARIPDLWVGRPVVITGRLTGDVASSVLVHGRVGGEPMTFEVPIDATGPAERPALAQIWARMNIADLADRMTWASEPDALVGRIRTLALEYGLLSRFTAFVAVDSSRVTEGDHGVTVVQPVPVPDGVRYENTVMDPALAPSAGEH